MKEIDLKIDFENFYCPITGHQVLDPFQFNPSPAMVFLFVHRERSFEFLQKDLQEKFGEMYEDESRHKELYLYLTAKELIAEDNYLWITYGGPPFGAVSMCFNMGYEDPNAPEEHPSYLMGSITAENEEEN